MATIKTNIRRFASKIFSFIAPEFITLRRNFDNLTNALNHINLEIEHSKNNTQQIMNYINQKDPESLKNLDKKNLPEIFKTRLGYELNLDNPKTFNEKLQWLKIYYRKPEMTIMADKYRVREYLQQKGFGQYLNKLYGVYESVEKVKRDWSNLPNSFVLKVNHWSGGNIIIKNKNVIDFNELEKLDTLLNQNYYYKYRCGEWPYKDIEPCIIAEDYLEDETGGLLDYKVFCFNGIARYVQLDVDRFTNHTRCFYDLNWAKQAFVIQYPLYYGNVAKPTHFNEMIKVAENMSKGFPHLRVDFYVVSEELFFGEFTFTHESGFGKFYPEEWDKKLGEFIDLDNYQT